LKQAVAEMRYGQELWRPFLALALILMAAEMLLGRSSASRKGAERGEREGLTSPQEKLQIVRER
jgi:hypothetical protein